MSINKDIIIEALKRSSKKLADTFGDEFVGMILFGSWAREEATIESDVDVLVIFKSLEGFDFRSKVYNMIAEYVKAPLTLIDVKINEVTSEEYELTPLMLNILYDGIVIWDKDDILKELIKKGKEFIEKAKLIRYRVSDGKYGWKRIDGKPIALCNIKSGDND